MASEELLHPSPEDYFSQDWLFYIPFEHPGGFDLLGELIPELRDEVLELIPPKDLGSLRLLNLEHKKYVSWFIRKKFKVNLKVLYFKKFQENIDSRFTSSFWDSEKKIHENYKKTKERLKYLEEKVSKLSKKIDILSWIDFQEK